MRPLALALVLVGAAAPSPGQDVPMGEGCRREVFELHRFFEEWFDGRVADDEATFARVADALGEGFLLVSPDGTREPRERVIGDLRAAYGRWTEEHPGRIWIEDVEVRYSDPDRALVVYVEWQESGGVTRGRISSALFGRSGDAPNGVVWLHLQETWLSEDSTRP